MELQWTATALGNALHQASTDSDYRRRFLDDTVADLNEKGEPWDLVLIDRGSHTHQSWKDGELHTNPTDVVVEADLYQDEIEWAWEDKPEGASITVGGSIGVDARPDSFEPGELDELSLPLTCRRDGDSPIEDVTFTDECSGDVEDLGPDGAP